jgi:hypothetical protein
MTNPFIPKFVRNMFQIAYEHASQYGEIVSFEYNDKEGSSKVVYRTPVE